MNGRNHHQCSRKFKWAGGKTILEAPARTGTAFGFEGNDEEAASSFGRSSHADTDRKTLDLADQTISGAADNRRGGRDKRKDIHKKKEQSWERNQTHTHTIRTAWTSTTRPT